MVMARIVSRCSHSWRCQGGTGRPRTGDGLGAGGTDRGQMSGVDPGVDQSPIVVEGGAPKASRDHCIWQRRVRAVGEGAGRVGEDRAGA